MITYNKTVNAAIVDFLIGHSEWDHRESPEDNFIVLENFFHSGHAPSSEEYENLCVELTMKIHTDNEYIWCQFSMHDEYNGNNSDAIIRAELIVEIESIINESLIAMADKLHGYSFDKFNIHDELSYIETNEYLRFIKPRINNNNYENPLITLIGYNDFDRKQTFIVALLDNGADPYLENNKGVSAKSLLVEKKNLPDYLEALKEKWLLEEHLYNDDEPSQSL